MLPVVVAFFIVKFGKFKKYSWSNCMDAMLSGIWCLKLKADLDKY